jgi:hypothetical protein
MLGRGGEARGLRALGRGIAGHVRLAGRAQGSLLLEHLQRGSCRAPEAGGWPLLTEAEAFGSLGRREQFERLAGAVDLLGAAFRARKSAASPTCRHAEACGIPKGGAPDPGGADKAESNRIRFRF